MAVVDSVVEVNTNKKSSLFYPSIYILFIILGGGGGGDFGGYRGRGEYLYLNCLDYNYLFLLKGGDRGGDYRGGGGGGGGEYRGSGRGASHGSSRDNRSNPY